MLKRFILWLRQYVRKARLPVWHSRMHRCELQGVPRGLGLVTRHNTAPQP